MIEYVIYAFEQNGKIGGLGHVGRATEHEINAATGVHIFANRDARICVLVVTGLVTEDDARKLAIAIYEGRSRKINFNDAARIDREAAIWHNAFT